MRNSTKSNSPESGLFGVSRRAALAALASAAVFASPARADDSAERFIGGVLEKANTIFQTTDDGARDAEIEKLVDQYVDMNRVSMFVLGQYARQMSPDQKAAYQPLFRRYATTIYQKALSQYSGQRLGVTGSVDRSPSDVIVATKIIDAKPGDQFARIEFTWRVLKDKAGNLSVVDAGADGVWLAIEQQSQFKAVIANNGGGAAGLDALIADLKVKVKEQSIAQ